MNGMPRRLVCCILLLSVSACAATAPKAVDRAAAIDWLGRASAEAAKVDRPSSRLDVLRFTAMAQARLRDLKGLRKTVEQFEQAMDAKSREWDAPYVEPIVALWHL